MTAASGLAAWTGIAVAGTAFGLLMIGLWLLGPTTRPENRRKLFHVGAGLLALSLPWLMAARWCAVVLMSGAVIALLAVRVVPPLRATLGAALYRVGRRTHGEFYFALAVLALFLASPHGSALYQIPILILMLADPMAAFIGISYGRHHLTRWAAAKTVEGSLAFCLTAGFATATTLVLAGYQVSAALSIAIVVAVAVTAAEATGPAGSDNFLVPTAAYLVLGPLLDGAVIPTLLTVAAVAAAARLAIGLLAPGPNPHAAAAPTRTSNPRLGTASRVAKARAGAGCNATTATTGGHRTGFRI